MSPLIECRSNRMLAQDMSRQLLVWQGRQAEHVRRLDKLERQYRKRFGPLDSASTTNARAEVLLAALQKFL